MQIEFIQSSVNMKDSLSEKNYAEMKLRMIFDFQRDQIMSFSVIQSVNTKQKLKERFEIL